MDIDCLNLMAKIYKNFPEFYSANLRGILFSGFLSVGALLYALKSTIVFGFKEQIFDSPEYEKEVLIKQKKLEPSRDVFNPLENLSNSLLNSARYSFAAAIVQVTIGLVPSPAFSLMAFFTAACAMGYIFWGMRVYKKNMGNYFRIINKTKNERLVKLIKDAEKEQNS